MADVASRDSSVGMILYCWRGALDSSIIAMPMKGVLVGGMLGSLPKVATNDVVVAVGMTVTVVDSIPLGFTAGWHKVAKMSSATDSALNKFITNY